MPSDKVELIKNGFMVRNSNLFAIGSPEKRFPLLQCELVELLQ